MIIYVREIIQRRLEEIDQHIDTLADERAILAEELKREEPITVRPALDRRKERKPISEATRLKMSKAARKREKQKKAAG